MKLGLSMKDDPSKLIAIMQASVAMVLEKIIPRIVESYANIEL